MLRPREGFTPLRTSRVEPFRFRLAAYNPAEPSIWDADAVQALRCELAAGHLGRDTADLDDRGAMRLNREMAEANRHQVPAHGAGDGVSIIALNAKTTVGEIQPRSTQGDAAAALGRLPNR